MSQVSTLSSCVRGTKVVVDKINVSPLIVLRLSEMGIFPESEITVVDNQKTGPLIIRSKRSNIALHRKIAENTFIISVN